MKEITIKIFPSVGDTYKVTFEINEEINIDIETQIDSWIENNLQNVEHYEMVN